jgi:hypothetical protein
MDTFFLGCTVPEHQYYQGTECLMEEAVVRNVMLKNQLRCWKMIFSKNYL